MAKFRQIWLHWFTDWYQLITYLPACRHLKVVRKQDWNSRLVVWQICECLKMGQPRPSIIRCQDSNWRHESLRITTRPNLWMLTTSLCSTLFFKTCWPSSCQKKIFCSLFSSGAKYKKYEAENWRKHSELSRNWCYVLNLSASVGLVFKKNRANPGLFFVYIQTQILQKICRRQRDSN